MQKKDKKLEKMIKRANEALKDKMLMKDKRMARKKRKS